MNWTPINKYAECSDQGHTVSASKGADGWRYAAWGPEEMPGAKGWEWLEATGLEHYRRGAVMPQRSPLLGIYATAAEARAACEQHHAADLAA